MKAPALQKGLALSAWIDDGVPGWVLADAMRLRQVLTNLISNAIAFTPAGRIRVEVAGAGDEGLRISVADTGVGIAEADQAIIFERFVQADGSTTRSNGGAGLGLAIVRELVELMEGEIRVESAVGEGSVFTFTMHAKPCAAPAAREPAPGPRRERPATAPLDVLVAEDNRTNQRLVAALLRRAGHRPTIVGNGAEAVAAAIRTRFDIALMDIQMPVMDGFAAARRIRALDGAAGQLPIIALTASTLDESRDRCTEAGISACLAKPIDFDALLDSLAEACDGTAMTVAAE